MKTRPLSLAIIAAELSATANAYSWAYETRMTSSRISGLLRATEIFGQPFRHQKLNAGSTIMVYAKLHHVAYLGW